MTSPHRRAPNNDAELLRQLVRDVRELQQASTARLGQWTVKQDPVTKKLQAVSPDSTHDLTPDPAARPDIVAGIMPGLFSAYRSITTGANCTAGNQTFAADWYDQVTLTSDRLEFDSATNSVLVQSTASILLVSVSQRVASGAVGSRQFRANILLTKPDSDPEIFSTGTNGYYNDGRELVFTDTRLVPVTIGDIISPGYWASESALGQFTGSKVATTFDIARVIDL